MTSITESGLGKGKKDLTVSMTDRDVSKSQVGNIISEESSAANDENIKYLPVLQYGKKKTICFPFVPFIPHHQPLDRCHMFLLLMVVSELSIMTILYVN